MRDTSLLQQALGISAPWAVTSSVFDADERRIDIHLDFAPGSRFACPLCGAASCPVHDTQQRSWRHLDFFQHTAFLHGRVPRIQCGECGVKTVALPWARPNSGFTLLFEALIMQMAAAMPVATLARQVGEHDTRLWRIIHHYVDEARARVDLSNVERVAIDETSARRGHDYITLVVDIDESRVIFATDGKDAQTIEAFARDLSDHGGKPAQIKQACIDMSPAFVAGLANHLPNAEITFDKFHAVKIVNEAVDRVRRAESKHNRLLAGTRYLWLRNPENLSDRQSEHLNALPLERLKTARAWQIKLSFQDLYQKTSRKAGASHLKRWYYWATHSRLPAMIEAARTISAHADGILRWFDSHIANGVIEAINSLIQAAKAKARGYRSNRNLIAMLYLIAGKLDMELPA